MTMADGPFLFGRPGEYAASKAKAFPGEGGPVIIEVDIPDSIVRRAVSDWFPLSQGLVQFDMGSGLEELSAAWSCLSKEIRPIT